ncbi:U3 small nucleolar RNA-associated protein 25 like protein, partial [Aduncisulcus paluster]
PMREECTRNGMNIVHLSQRLFIGVSDYDGPDVGRSAMGMLSDGVVRSVLMSERWYFYNRERLHGASNVIFLAPPFFPEFYVDFVKSLTHFVKGSTIMMLTNVFYAQDLCRITGKEIGIDLLTSRGTKDGRKTVKFSSKSP